MAITQYYVDPAIAGNSGTGTIGDPFGDLQYALDTVGAGVGRNAVDGDQFNIKAGTAEILAASLTLATYGTPTSSGPLILRGYTAAANDGGMGEIDCGGFTMWAASTLDYIIMAYLELHTFGNNDGVYLDDYITLFNCEIHKGASAPTSKSLVRVDQYAYVSSCYVHDPGTTGNCLRTGGSGSSIFGNYVVQNAVSYGILVVSSSAAFNIVLCSNAQASGIAGANGAAITNNIVYNTVAGTANGLNHGSSTGNTLISNNIVVGWSGVGGIGIRGQSELVALGYNAFYNNTNNYALADVVFIDGRANDVALAADPFTNAAGGDFSLTAAAKTALAGKGFPVNYLGAAAATVSNLNIGPIQLAATAPVAATRGRLIIPRR